MNEETKEAVELLRLSWYAEERARSMGRMLYDEMGRMLYDEYVAGCRYDALRRFCINNENAIDWDKMRAEENRLYKGGE